MLHTVLIDDNDYFDLVAAADDAKLPIHDFEAWAIADAINNWRRHKQGRAELVRLANSIHEGDYAELD